MRLKRGAWCLRGCAGVCVGEWGRWKGLSGELGLKIFLFWRNRQARYEWTRLGKKSLDQVFFARLHKEDPKRCGF